jgi:polar amino acid transport system substrate-binding protein
MSAFARRASSLLLAAFLCISAARAFADAPLRAGSDVSYAPLEFYSGSHQMRGFDVDLASAIAQKIGTSVVISNHVFDDLIPAVKKGSFDLAISALSDTRPREMQVDFIDYMLAGSGMLVPAGNPKHVFDLGALCGLRVDVQKGTSQEAALREQSKRCKDVGLAEIKINAFPTDDAGFKSFTSGNSDVHVTDYPVVAYLAKTNDHKYEVAGRQFALVPYGIAIAKSNPALRQRVVAALQAVIADGTYDKLLKKWGLEQGALRSVPVNAGTLFSH